MHGSFPVDEIPIEYVKRYYVDALPKSIDAPSDE